MEDGEPYNGRVRSEVREYLRATKPAEPKPAAADPMADEDEIATPAPAAEPAKPELDATSEDAVELDVDALDIDDLDL